MHIQSLSVSRTQANLARANATNERRLSWLLVAVLAVATGSVLATTSALSQHHARELAALTRP